MYQVPFFSLFLLQAFVIHQLLSPGSSTTSTDFSRYFEQRCAKMTPMCPAYRITVLPTKSPFFEGRLCNEG